jgi:hypothetical protein
MPSFFEDDVKRRVEADAGPRDRAMLRLLYAAGQITVFGKNGRRRSVALTESVWNELNQLEKTVTFTIDTDNDIVAHAEVPANLENAQVFERTTRVARHGMQHVRKLPVLMLTVHRDDDSIFAAVCAGALDIARHRRPPIRECTCRRS